MYPASFLNRSQGDVALQLPLHGACLWGWRDGESCLRVDYALSPAAAHANVSGFTVFTQVRTRADSQALSPQLCSLALFAGRWGRAASSKLRSAFISVTPLGFII